MSVNAYQAYRKTQIATASQGELILLLFDGAIRFANQAKSFIEAKDFNSANDKLIRIQDIISELMSSLDMEKGEISNNLYQLYQFIYDRLVQVNMKKDVTMLDETIDLMLELRDTWRQVVNKKE